MMPGLLLALAVTSSSTTTVSVAASELERLRRTARTHRRTRDDLRVCREQLEREPARAHAALDWCVVLGAGGAAATAACAHLAPEASTACTIAAVVAAATGAACGAVRIGGIDAD